MDPLLPPELEREIFEVAAVTHPSMIPTLLQVARRTLKWIEPLLYRVIWTHHSPPQSAKADALMRAMDSKPPNFFRDAVRHLFLDNASEWSQKQIIAVLTLCSGIINLAVIPHISQPELLPILEGMRIERFAGPLAPLFGSYAVINIRHPFLASVTHLDLFDTILEADTQIYAELALMPVLTHLALNHQIPTNVMRCILSDCTQLKVLVNLRTSGDVPEMDVIDDPRFVLMLIHRYYWADWEIGAEGGEDFWAAVDIFLDKKRRGEIPASVYLTVHD
ncbi:hypothetical protein C8R43DRAFT_935540 [Mycena crocata]|nr:hypothetical protein C8R43DRAFT_935540 [Mycena crocata]